MTGEGSGLNLSRRLIIDEDMGENHPYWVHQLAESSRVIRIRERGETLYMNQREPKTISGLVVSLEND